MDQHGPSPDPEPPEPNEPAPLRRLPRPPRSDGEVTAAMAAAFAEAFRAQSEALHRIDATQRQIQALVEKGDRSQQMVASTKALNETFKGLSQIQRGLLDKVSEPKNVRSRGTPFFILALLLLMALALGVLIGDDERLLGSANSAAANREIAGLREERKELEGRVLTLQKEQIAEAKKAVQKDRDKEAEIQRLHLAAEDSATRIEAMQKKLDSQEVRLREYVQLQNEMEDASRLKMEVAILRQQLRSEKQRADRIDEERAKLAGLLMDERIEGRSPAKKILEAAEKAGLAKSEATRKKEKVAEEAGRAKGVVPLKGSALRSFMRRVNRLLQAAEEGEIPQLLRVASVRDGSRLQGVYVGRYEGVRLLNGIEAGGLELYLDPKADTLELRFFDGHIQTGKRKVPFAEGAHSVFLRGVGAKGFLERSAGAVRVEKGGRLTWLLSRP